MKIFTVVIIIFFSFIIGLYSQELVTFCKDSYHCNKYLDDLYNLIGFDSFDKITGLSTIKILNNGLNFREILITMIINIVLMTSLFICC